MQFGKARTEYGLLWHSRFRCCQHLFHGHEGLYPCFSVCRHTKLARFQAEIDLVVKKALEAGATGAFPCSHWAQGGAGIATLASAVVEACQKPSEFRFLYPLEWSLKEKIEIIGEPNSRACCA